MLISDFPIAHIISFTPREIENTGAKLEDVKLELIVAYQRWRNRINRRVHFCYNGLTTGGHKSPEHMNGAAGDCWLDKKDGIVNFKDCYYNAIDAGFMGIGIYYNKETGLYSLHLDIGKRRRSWGAWKNLRKEGWNYVTLLTDPREFLK